MYHWQCYHLVNILMNLKKKFFLPCPPPFNSHRLKNWLEKSNASYKTNPCDLKLKQPIQKLIIKHLFIYHSIPIKMVGSSNKSDKPAILWKRWRHKRNLLYPFCLHCWPITSCSYEVAISAILFLRRLVYKRSCDKLL